MEQKDIEKAASKHSASLWDKNIIDCSSDFDFVYDSFVAGAEWRINSVWHKPCDIAEPGKNCLVEHIDGDGNVCICIDWRSEYEWVKACHYNKILRWAYIGDLLPILC